MVGVQADILDVVTLDGGAASQYLFTAKGGIVQARGGKKGISLKKVHAEFGRARSARGATDDFDGPVALAHRPDGTSYGLDFEAFGHCGSGSPPGDAVAMAAQHAPLWPQYDEHCGLAWVPRTRRTGQDTGTEHLIQTTVHLPP